MEETNALLSRLVQTKSVERLLAPIATKLSQLIILSEEYETGKRDSFPCDLRWSASILKATETFVGVARRLGQNSSDEELRDQMPLVCDMLCVSAENLVTAQQRVSVEKFSAPSRKNLIRTAKDILEGTIKVFLLMDDAEVRAILRSANWVTDRLGVLTAIKTMKTLVPSFKNFVESLMLLINLLKKRQADLVHPRQREGLLTHMATLRRLIPMLSSALQTYVKYSTSPQAKASRDYVVGSVLDCLKEIEDLVRNPHTQDCDYPEDEEDEQAGHFLSTIDKIVDCLTEEYRREAVVDVGAEFDLLIETAVRHSMAVAHLSTPHHRSLITTNSQRVMHQRSIISQLGKTHQNNPTYEELGDDFNSACDLLETEVTDLERHVNSAILQLVVEAYSETTQPMDRLVKAALKNIMNRDYIPEEESEDILEPYISSFHAHSDRMCQVARFLGASSAEPRRVRVLRSCIGLLEKLDPELVPATIACRSDVNNKAAVEHLRLLKKEWCSTVDTLVNAIDDIIDSNDFIEISESELREAVNRCKSSLYSEATDVAEVTRHVIGLTSRIVHVAKATMEKNDDAVFRNAVMIHVSQLNKVIPAIKTSANRVLNDMGELRLHETLHKRVDSALATVGKLRRALHGEGHVDLMDPDRVQARGPDHLNALNAALAACDVDDVEIKQTHSQQHKTATTKTEAITKVRLKTYIAELTDSRLAELQRLFVTAAVGGDQKRLDMLGNDILVHTNHLVETAHTTEQHGHQHRETLSACCLQLSQLTPALLDLGRKMSLGDMDQVEPLHKTAEEWAGTLTYLEGLVDSILSKWVEVSHKVVDAAKVGNTPLLTAQVQHLDEHRRHIGMIRDMLTEGTSAETIVTQDTLQTLQSHLDELESQTAMLATVADMLASTNNDDEKAQLERTAREWGALAFSIAALIDKLAVDSLSQVKGEVTTPDWDRVGQVNDVICRFTEDTVRVKDAVSKVTKCMESAERRTKLEEMLEDIDLVVSKMAQNCDTLTKQHAPQKSADRLYAPLKIMLLQWHWAVKIQEMWLTIDDVTLEYSIQMEHLLVPGITSLTASPDTSPDPAQSVSQLKERVSQTVSMVREALTPVRDPAQRLALQRDLTDFSTLTDSMVTAVHSHTNTPTDQSQSQVRMLGRSWACKAHSLMYSLSDISAVESSVVREASSLLKGPGKFACSTPGDPASAMTVSSAMTPTSRPAGERTLRDLSNTPSRPKQSITAKGSTSSTESPNTTIIKSPKRGSLRKSVTFGQGTYGDRETQTVSAFVADAASNISTTKSHGTKMLDTSKQMSYKELSAAPRIQHRQPEPPSAKSGLQRVTSRSRSFDLDANKWEDDNNAIVRVAKEMTEQLNFMANYTREEQDGLPRNNTDLITAAKAVAKNGESLVKFAKILAKYCVDSRLSKDLMFYADHVPMVATQLSMLASVKAASPDDLTTEKMLGQNAEKLLSAISKMLNAAEAACVKGLRQPPSDALDETEAIVLATQWHHKFTRHRRIEKKNMSMDELGLRQVSQPRPAPTLTQIVGKK